MAIGITRNDASAIAVCIAVVWLLGVTGIAYLIVLAGLAVSLWPVARSAADTAAREGWRMAAIDALAGCWELLRTTDAWVRRRARELDLFGVSWVPVAVGPPGDNWRCAVVGCHAGEDARRAAAAEILGAAERGETIDPRRLYCAAAAAISGWPSAPDGKGPSTDPEQALADIEFRLLLLDVSERRKAESAVIIMLSISPSRDPGAFSFESWGGDDEGSIVGPATLENIMAPYLPASAKPKGQTAADRKAKIAALGAKNR